MRLKHIFQTHEGMIRDHNEDNFTIVFGAEFGGVGEAPTSFEPDEKGTVLMVADGMGGMNAGEEASRLAVEAVNEYFEGLGEVSEDQVAVHMKRVCIEANNRIVEHAKKFPETKGMGTTIVVAWLRDEAAHIGWVGDSRAYLLRNGTLKEVTKDHSLVQEWVDEGKINKEQAFYHPQNNIVTQSLGSPSDAIRPDYIKEPLASGDQLLLCSDGLNGMLLDPDIEQIMRTGGHDIKMTADRLIKAANDKGGKDNITVILADIEEAEGAVVLEEPVAVSALADTAETGAKPIRGTAAILRQQRSWLIVAVSLLLALLLLTLKGEEIRKTLFGSTSGAKKDSVNTIINVKDTVKIESSSNSKEEKEEVNNNHYRPINPEKENRRVDDLVTHDTEIDVSPNVTEESTVNDNQGLNSGIKEGFNKSVGKKSDSLRSTLKIVNKGSGNESNLSSENKKRIVVAQGTNQGERKGIKYGDIWIVTPNYDYIYEDEKFNKTGQIAYILDRKGLNRKQTVIINTNTGKIIHDTRKSNNK